MSSPSSRGGGASALFLCLALATAAASPARPAADCRGVWLGPGGVRLELNDSGQGLRATWTLGLETRKISGPLSLGPESLEVELRSDPGGGGWSAGFAYTAPPDFPGRGRGTFTLRLKAGPEGRLSLAAESGGRKLREVRLVPLGGRSVAGLPSGPWRTEGEDPDLQLEILPSPGGLTLRMERASNPILAARLELELRPDSAGVYLGRATSPRGRSLELRLRLLSAEELELRASSWPFSQTRIYRRLGPYTGP